MHNKHIAKKKVNCAKKLQALKHRAKNEFLGKIGMLGRSEKSENGGRIVALAFEAEVRVEDGACVYEGQGFS